MRKKEQKIEVQRSYNASEIIKLEAKVARLKKELHFIKQKKNKKTKIISKIDGIVVKPVLI